MISDKDDSSLDDLKIAILNAGRGAFAEGNGDAPFCNFCGQGKGEYEVLIAGLGVHICDSCVDACAKIVADRKTVT